jgi:hypothetical protein
LVNRDAGTNACAITLQRLARRQKGCIGTRMITWSIAIGTRLVEH